MVLMLRAALPASARMLMQGRDGIPKILGIPGNSCESVRTLRNHKELLEKHQQDAPYILAMY